MMAVAYCFLTFVLSLLTGGGNDLLDYAPSEAYWREKKVDVSFQAMLAELTERPGEDVTKQIAELGSPNAETRDKAALRIREVGGAAALKPLAEAADAPEAEVRRRARLLLRQIGGDEIERGVRRLMAIRTLGEFGKPEAVATLKPLLASKELFVADYARTAIDLIEGRRSTDARAVAAGVADDVWLLPAECRTVGQLVPRRGEPMSFAEFMAAKTDGKANDRNRATREDNAAMVTRMVLSLADKIGNVRIDAATFGIAGTIVRTDGKRGGNPGDTGYLALVIRGRYHSDWVRTFARSEQVPTQNIDGVEVFQPDGESAWIMPSDDLFVYVAAPRNVERPVKALAAAVKQGKHAAARADADTRKLIESLDTKGAVLWAAAAVTPEQKALPFAGAFDTITLLGTREGKTLNLKMTARGSDPEKVKAAVDVVSKHAKDSAEFLAGIHGMPLIDMSVELLRSVVAQSDGTSATVTAKLQANPVAILSFPDLHEDELQFREEAPAHPRLRPETK